MLGRGTARAIIVPGGVGEYFLDIKPNAIEIRDSFYELDEPEYLPSQMMSEFRALFPPFDDQVLTARKLERD